MIRRTFIVATLFALTTAALAASKPSANKSGTVVDQGTFGIFLNGQLVATETFSIRQNSDSSVTTSKLHSEAGLNTPIQEQTSELVLLPNGNLSRYEWKQLAPSHNSAVVDVNDQFLAMHINMDGKVTEQPFFLTPDVFVLDDYFFSSREVLLWRYLASSCKPRPAGDGCDLARTRFAVLVPRRRSSDQIYIELKGYDDTPLNGRPQHLRHFVIQSDGPEWHLWLDANHKLLRISIPDTGTEILRQEK